MPSLDWRDQTKPVKDQAIEQTLQASIAFPVMLCSVSRKQNLGNFENTDIMAAVAIPIMAFPEDGMEEFRKAAADAADLGFKIVSKETGDRYDLIANMRAKVE